MCCSRSPWTQETQMNELGRTTTAILVKQACTTNVKAGQQWLAYSFNASCSHSKTNCGSSLEITELCKNSACLAKPTSTPNSTHEAFCSSNFLGIMVHNLGVRSRISPEPAVCHVLSTLRPPTQPRCMSVQRGYILTVLSLHIYL